MLNTETVNRRILLAERPTVFPEKKHFQYDEAAIKKPGKGEFVVRNQWISLDPAMRGWMSSMKSYIPPVEVGDVMRAFSAGIVVDSNHPSFTVGMEVCGVFGMQDYAVSDGRYVRHVRPGIPLNAMLGPVGLPGITAYFGLLDIGNPKAGETVVVSAAAGAVGSAVVQIAKMQGCRVVGIAGGAEKCAFVRSLGADETVDYKGGHFSEAFSQAVPGGVDIYFDNVGGDALEYALDHLNLQGRVVLCGAISRYNKTSSQGPGNYLSLLINRGRMQGLIYFDYIDRFDEAEEALSQWVREQRLKYKLDIVQGLQHAPTTLGKLFDGTNTGKLLLKLFDDLESKELL